jgi:hypothetical protein
VLVVDGASTVVEGRCEKPTEVLHGGGKGKQATGERLRLHGGSFGKCLPSSQCLKSCLQSHDLGGVNWEDFFIQRASSKISYYSSNPPGIKPLGHDGSNKTRCSTV